MGESGVGVRRTGEVGSEREERPKVLLEGAPLKAATRQGGRVGPTRGLPRMLRSWRSSSMSGDPGGSKARGEGDRVVLPGLGTSKTSESKVSAMRMVGGRGREVTARGGPRRGKSSEIGDKKAGLAGYWRTGDASGLSRWKDTYSEVRRG